MYMEKTFFSYNFYYKVLKNMNLQDKIKNSKIKKHEFLFDNMENLKNSFEEKYFKNDWIELIENYDLYVALKKLKDEEKKIIELIFFKGLTQKEIAMQFKTSHQNVGKKIKNVTEKIKKII